MFGIYNYSKILKVISSNNLIITNNWKKNNYNRYVLLRHDIDFSLDYALKIAKFEYKNKIKSTYFFLVSSNMYNLFSRKNIKIVKNIKKLRHKISLHYDPTIHEDPKSFLIEKNIFEKIFDVKLDIISIHRPNNFFLTTNKSFYGIKHTYQKKYFNKLTYISDSGGRPVIDLVKNYVKKKNKTGLQLLLHPIWWTFNSQSPTTTLNNWIKDNNEFTISDVALNCKTYKLK